MADTKDPATPTSRSRLVRTVALPGAALLLVWVLVSAVAIHDARAARSIATGVRAEVAPVVDVLVAVQQERRLALQHLSPSSPSGQRTDEEALLSQRTQTDQAISRLRATGSGNLPHGFARLPDHRTAVDAGTVPYQEVSDFYGGLLDAGTQRLESGARAVADPVAGHQLRTAAELFRAGARMTAAVSLADDALASGGFTAEQHLEFAHEVGGYRAVLEPGLADLAPAASAVQRELVAGRGWHSLQDLQDQLVSAAPGSPAPLPDNGQWRRVGTEVSEDVLAMAVEQAAAATGNGVTAANRDLARTASVSAVGLIVLVAVTIALIRRIRALLVEIGPEPARSQRQRALTLSPRPSEQTAAAADVPTLPTRLTGS